MLWTLGLQGFRFWGSGFRVQPGHHPSLDPRLRRRRAEATQDVVCVLEHGGAEKPRVACAVSTQQSKAYCTPSFKHETRAPLAEGEM